MNERRELAREQVASLIAGLLTPRSFFAFDAAAVADVVIDGMATGPAGDGVPLLERLLKQVEKGDIDPRGRPLVLEDSPALLFLDGSSAAGPVAIAAAVKTLVGRVPELGAAVAVIKGGREIGHPAIPITGIAEAGFVGICSTTYLQGDSADSARTRIGVVAPTSDGSIARFETDEASVFGVVLSIVAGGHGPAAKAASSNRSVAEHIVVGIDPGRTTTLDKLTQKLAAFSELGTSVAPGASTVSVPSGRLAKLESVATEAGLEIPWNT